MLTVDREGSSETDGALCNTRLPVGHVLVRVWTLDTARELSGLRADLMGELADGAEPEPTFGSVADDVVLVASELATNGLKHGIAPTSVQLLRRGDDYLLDVSDRDLSWTPSIVGARAPGHGAFGLDIVKRVAVDVGWYRSDGTKHVWALFPTRRTVTLS